MRHKTLYAGLLLLLTASLLGCSSGNNDSSLPNYPVYSVVRTFGSLQFTIASTQSRFDRGALVPIQFRITNSGTTPIQFTMPSSQIFEIQVSSGNQSVWTYGRNSVFNNSITTYDIAAGETKIFGYDNLTWNQRTDGSSGTQVASGLYTIQAWLVPIKVNGVDVTSDQAKQNYTTNPIVVRVL